MTSTHIVGPFAISETQNSNLIQNGTTYEDVSEPVEPQTHGTSRLEKFFKRGEQSSSGSPPSGRSERRHSSSSQSKPVLIKYAVGGVEMSATEYKKLRDQRSYGREQMLAVQASQANWTRPEKWPLLPCTAITQEDQARLHEEYFGHRPGLTPPPGLGLLAAPRERARRMKGGSNSSSSSSVGNEGGRDKDLWDTSEEGLKNFQMLEKEKDRNERDWHLERDKAEWREREKDRLNNPTIASNHPPSSPISISTDRQAIHHNNNNNNRYDKKDTTTTTSWAKGGRKIQERENTEGVMGDGVILSPPRKAFPSSQLATGGNPPSSRRGAPPPSSSSLSSSTTGKYVPPHATGEKQYNSYSERTPNKRNSLPTDPTSPILPPNSNRNKVVNKRSQETGRGNTLETSSSANTATNNINFIDSLFSGTDKNEDYALDYFSPPVMHRGTTTNATNATSATATTTTTNAVIAPQRHSPIEEETEDSQSINAPLPSRGLGKWFTPSLSEEKKASTPSSYSMTTPSSAADINTTSTNHTNVGNSVQSIPSSTSVVRTPTTLEALFQASQSNESGSASTSGGFVLPPMPQNAKREQAILHSLVDSHHHHHHPNHNNNSNNNGPTHNQPHHRNPPPPSPSSAPTHSNAVPSYPHSSSIPPSASLSMATPPHTFMESESTSFITSLLSKNSLQGPTGIPTTGGSTPPPMGGGYYPMEPFQNNPVIKQSLAPPPPHPSSLFPNPPPHHNHPSHPLPHSGSNIPNPNVYNYGIPNSGPGSFPYPPPPSSAANPMTSPRHHQPQFAPNPSPMQHQSHPIPQAPNSGPPTGAALERWFGANIYQAPLPPMPSNAKMMSLEDLERK